jgi:hypothetical protein
MQENDAYPRQVCMPNGFGFDEEKFLHAKLYKHGLGGYLRTEEQAQTPAGC